MKPERVCMQTRRCGLRVLACGDDAEEVEQRKEFEWCVPDGGGINLCLCWNFGTVTIEGLAAVWWTPMGVLGC